MDIFNLHRALKHLYGHDAGRIKSRYNVAGVEDPDKSDGAIYVPEWPAELGAIPDQAALDAALVEHRREDKRAELKRHASSRARGQAGERDDRDAARRVLELSARYSKNLRGALTRAIVLSEIDSDDPELQVFRDKLDALEAKFHMIDDRQAEDTIEAEIDAAPDPRDVVVGAGSAHWPGGA